MRQKTVVLKHGATLGEEIKTLRTLFDKGYSYDRTEHCHDIDLIILNNWDTNRQEQMQQDIDRLHNIITDLTSEKDAYEEMLQQTQQELQDQQQINERLKAMVNSLYGEAFTERCLSEFSNFDHIRTDLSPQQTQPDPTRPDKTGEDEARSRMYRGYTVYSAKYEPISMSVTVPDYAVKKLEGGDIIAIALYVLTSEINVQIGLNVGITCEVIEHDPLRKRMLIKKL